MGVRITVQSLWTEVDASTFAYEFAQARIVIGRSQSADVQLPHAAVSGSHASIREQDAGYVLIDEGSTNGTRINDIRVAIQCDHVRAGTHPADQVTHRIYGYLVKTDV